MNLEEVKEYIKSLPFDFTMTARSADYTVLYFSDIERGVQLTVETDKYTGKYTVATVGALLYVYTVSTGVLTIPHPRLERMIREVEVIKRRGEYGVDRFRETC